VALARGGRRGAVSGGGSAGSVQRGGALDTGKRRRIYGVTAKSSGGGGEIARRRRYRAAVAQVGGERARVKFPAVGVSRVCETMPRCSPRLRYDDPDSVKHCAHQIFCSADADRAPAGEANLSQHALYRRLL
jgi:hypothetical protein